VHRVGLVVSQVAILVIVALIISGAPQLSFAQVSSGPASRVVWLGPSSTGYAFAPADEIKLLGLVNDIREAHHLAPLRMSPSLRQVARDHSRDMALRGYVGHGDPSGESFVDRLGRVLQTGTRVGENVAAVQTVEEANAAFAASEWHLQNMLNPVFRVVGIGVASAQATMMVTEDFAE